MNLTLPIYNGISVELIEEMKQYPSLCYEKTDLLISSIGLQGTTNTTVDIRNKQYQQVSNFYIKLCNNILEEVGIKHPILKGDTLDRLEDIIWHICEAIYFYDFQINTIDEHRKICISVINNRPIFYFSTLVWKVHLDSLNKYLALRKQYHQNGNYHSLAGVFREARNPHNQRGINDIGNLQTFIDTALEGWKTNIFFSFEYSSKNLITFKLMLNGDIVA